MWLANMDESVLLWINGLVGHSSLIDGVIRLFATDYFVPVILSLALLGLWFSGQDAESREHNQKTVIYAALSIAIASALVAIGNQFYYRDRPFIELPELLDGLTGSGRLFYPPHDSSFPSNMATIVFAIATAVFLGNRKLGAILFIPAFLVCFARVCVGVHYSLDIVGGIVLGVITACVISKPLAGLLNIVTDPVLRVLRKICLA